MCGCFPPSSAVYLSALFFTLHVLLSQLVDKEDVNSGVLCYSCLVSDEVLPLCFSRIMRVDYRDDFPSSAFIPLVRSANTTRSLASDTNPTLALNAFLYWMDSVHTCGTLIS